MEVVGEAVEVPRRGGGGDGGSGGGSGGTNERGAEAVRRRLASVFLYLLQVLLVLEGGGSGGGSGGTNEGGAISMAVLYST